MHIAICDDNVADRKHLERLLSREADARIKRKEDPLYIDSFGNIASLMHAPKIYDVFFIDMTCNPDEDGLYVANLLRADLIMAPVVLCSSRIDYPSKNSVLPDLIYLTKEIKPVEISHTISMVQNLLKQAEPTYEIRGLEKTVYIHDEDFIYAESVNNRQSIIYLTNDYVCHLPDSLFSLKCLMEKHSSLIELRKGYLVNSLYVNNFSFTALTLKNGKKLPLALGESMQLKTILSRI
ncbi:MAG: hypothetical protein PHE02_10435 [Lachnospiraceae bacterium]|nr:hypothetical protein [Lachnospiraceae bacterium]